MNNDDKRRPTFLVEEEPQPHANGAPPAEEADLHDWASKLLSILPILGLITIGIIALFNGFPADNKTEIGIVIAGLIALSKDVYSYKYGSSRKGNSG